MTRADVMQAPSRTDRGSFSRRTRNTLLSVHIATSVALLGDLLGLTAILVSATDAEPAAAHESYETMAMFSLIFGIPLSLAALISGVVLGLGTRWGLFRYPWVVAKLGLLVAVILTGALVVGPAEEVLASASTTASAREAAEDRTLIALVLQVAALALSTGLSVFKPGRRRVRRVRPRPSTA